MKYLWVALSWYLVSCSSPKPALTIEQLREAIINEHYLRLDSLKFQHVVIIEEFTGEKLDSVDTGKRDWGGLANFKNKANLAHLISNSVDTARGLAQSLEFDSKYTSLLDVSNIMVLALGGDTIVDVVVTAINAAPTNFPECFHILYDKSVSIIIGSLESAYNFVEPFGDFNNDGKLDYLNMNWTSNYDTINLYTIIDGHFVKNHNYQIICNNVDNLDLSYSMFDKDKTRLGIYQDGELVFVP